MLRSTLIAASAALLCGTGFAQQQMDWSDVHPITSPPKNAGTFNLATHKWMSPSKEAQFRANSLTVYNNTCTWTGAAYYTGTPQCADHYDEGRIPGGVGGPNPPGSSTDNAINFFQIGYCTNFATGVVNIKLGFFDSLNGPCVGGLPPTPPALSTNPALAAFLPLPPAIMPGDTAPGGAGVSCWIVGFNLGNGGFCMQSDGDGIFDNAEALDDFSWSWTMDNIQSNGPAASGPIVSGEPGHPSSGGPGSCTYNIPCGTDFFTGAPCGTGLPGSGLADAVWINIDQDPVGGGNTGLNCVSTQLPPGTGCYFFGGYPGNQYTSYWLVLGSAGSCAGCTGSPTNYCTAGTTTHGCNASIGLSSGVPSPRNLAPAMITVSNVEGQKSGLIFYGLSQVAVPWGTGTSFLCVKAPTQRTPAQNSGGTVNLCNGSLTVDINQAIATNGGTVVGVPAFAGQNVFAQGWFRDPPAPKTTNLSNGLQFTFAP
jgi:hypothetical protein